MTDQTTPSEWAQRQAKERLSTWFRFTEWEGPLLRGNWDEIEMQMARALDAARAEGPKVPEWETELRELLAENPGDEIEPDEIVPAVRALQEQVDSILVEMQERAARHKKALEAAEARAKEAEEKVAILERDAAWRREWHARLGRDVAESEGKFYEQVAAQQETIRALRAALPSTCDSVHHRKADRHEAGEPCPVLMRAEAALKEQGADDAK